MSNIEPTMPAANTRQEAFLLVLVYVAAGPPIALGVVGFVGAAWALVVDHTLRPFSEAVFFVLLSWIGGWAPALVTGIAAAWSRYRGRAISYLTVALIGAVSSFAYGRVISGWRSPGNSYTGDLFMAGLGIIGAVGCRYFARALHQPRSAR